MSKNNKLIAIINSETDPEKLHNWIRNARKQQADDVEQVAIQRLIEINALTNHDDPNDPLVLDFWKSITALEFALSDERGKTIRLTRTRQKISRVGVKKTLEDLAVSAKASDGYFLLRDRGMLDMSAEAVVLRHPALFDDEIIKAAQSRLDANSDD
ncbi:MAG: hypothetical protein COB39_01325 [Marinosulfonomonas sp.]|nr:MAG: hypothetical protein COB39_01325 [Marinosulfonomonas sp.]